MDVRSVCIAFGLGCPRAQVDTARLCEYVSANGWSIADRVEEADFILVTTCGYSTDYEETSFSLLQSAERRKKAGAKLVVVGCLAGICDARLSETFGADVLASRSGPDLDAILGATVGFEDVADPGEIEPYVEQTSRHFEDAERHPGDNWFMAHLRGALTRTGIKERLSSGWRRGHQGAVAPSEHICSLRVARGCMGQCTFCAIRFGAGVLHSKPLETVLAEFDTGRARGYQEFTLIAGDLGCYGQDVGTNVAELLGEMMSRSADFKLTLLDFDMRWLIEYSDVLTDLFARHGARIRFLSLPLQSGSERILQEMRRGHTAAAAERALVTLRAACPEMALGTQILVGFPGETERDFDETLRILRVGQFDCVGIYDYQDRPKTEASRMPEKVPRAVIRSRSLRARREFGGRWEALQYRAKDWGLR